LTSYIVIRHQKTALIYLDILLLVKCSMLMCNQKLCQLVKNVQLLLGLFLSTIHKVTNLDGVEVPLDIMPMTEGELDGFYCAHLCIDKWRRRTRVADPSPEGFPA